MGTLGGIVAINADRGVTGIPVNLSDLVIDTDLEMDGFDITFTTGVVRYVDIVMEDYFCVACGEDFKEGDHLDLIVRLLRKHKGRRVINTVPIHDSMTCKRKGIKWRLEDGRRVKL